MTFQYNPLTGRLDIGGSAAGGGVTNVLGTAGRVTSTGGANPVIDVSQSFPGYDPRKVIVQVDDMIPTVQGVIFGPSQSTYLPSTGNRQGIERSDRDFADDFAFFFGGGDTLSTANFSLGAGVLSCNWVINLGILSDNTNPYFTYVGMLDTVGLFTVAPPTGGVYFSYKHNVNSGNWVLNCATGGVTSSFNTAIPGNTNYVNLGFSVNAAATLATFFINGISVGTVSTNIPTEQLYSICGNWLTTNFSPGMIVDLYYLTYILTTPR